MSIIYLVEWIIRPTRQCPNPTRSQVRYTLCTSEYKIRTLLYPSRFSLRCALTPQVVGYGLTHCTLMCGTEDSAVPSFIVPPQVPRPHQLSDTVPPLHPNIRNGKPCCRDSAPTPGSQAMYTLCTSTFWVHTDVYTVQILHTLCTLTVSHTVPWYTVRNILLYPELSTFSNTLLCTQILQGFQNKRRPFPTSQKYSWSTQWW